MQPQMARNTFPSPRVVSQLSVRYALPMILDRFRLMDECYTAAD